MSDSIILGNLHTEQKLSKKLRKSTRKILINDESGTKIPKEIKSVSQSKYNKTSDEKPSSNYKSSRLFDEDFKNIPQITPVLKDVKYEELFSNVNFCDLNLNELLVSCLEQRFNLTKATKIQALSIPSLLKGNDALIKSVTGSGKTLAYSIPLVQLLQSIEPKVTRTDGLFAVIILPTRELAVQTYECIDRLLNPFRRIVIGLIIGGEKKKSEKARIRKGLNIMATTPGRLLDHINRTKNLSLKKLKWLIIDEADRLYEQGFSAIISQIIECIKNSLESKIQTILLSATISEGVKELAGLSLHNPEFIDVGNDEKLQNHLENITLPSSLINNFIVVPAKLRLVLLSCIIFHSLKNDGQTTKIIVFVSCQDVVDFYSTLFTECLNKFLKLESNIKIFKLHGNMNQNSRIDVFKKFSSADFGILFCTDVASRGLDLPNVDLVIQMSSPSIVEDFVHRVGRTARLGKTGKSILILLPSEIKFIEYVQEEISINFNIIKMEDYFKSADCLNFSKKYHTQQELLAHLQQLYEKSIMEKEELHVLASKAYLSYLRSYASYPRQLSSYLPFRQLHLGHIAKSFALLDPPKMLASKMNKKFKSNQNLAVSLKRKSIPLEERYSEFGGLMEINNKKKKMIKINPK